MLSIEESFFGVGGGVLVVGFLFKYFCPYHTYSSPPHIFATHPPHMSITNAVKYLEILKSLKRNSNIRCQGALLAITMHLIKCLDSII